MRRAMQPVGLAIKSLQCMYLCSLKYLIFSLSHRLLFERVINLQMAMKKMKFFFKKFLDFEEKHGDEASVAAVKRKAQEYVDSHWVLPVPETSACEPSLSAVPLVHCGSLHASTAFWKSHEQRGFSWHFWECQEFPCTPCSVLVIWCNHLYEDTIECNKPEIKYIYLLYEK